MKLYLVQHGDALTKDVDPGRPLSPRGEQDVQRVAGFLADSGVSVGRILHSGKMRAHQTADILAEAILLKGATEAVDGLSPNDPVQDFATAVDKFEDDTMVVGHLPFMEKMVSYLVSDQQDNPITAYKPGSVVCLEQDEEGRWWIQWMLRPELLNR